MQQDADFITADFLYMFRASSAHHQEYKILTRQPPVQVVMVTGRSSLRHIRDETESFVPNMSAVIKSASCCITSAFYLILYYDARKHKIKIQLHVYCGSTFPRDSGHPDYGFVVYLSLQINERILTHIRPRRLPFTSLPSHHSSS